MNLDMIVAYFEPSEEFPTRSRLASPTWIGTLAEFYEKYKIQASAMKKIAGELSKRGYATWAGTADTSGWLLTESEHRRLMGEVQKHALH